MRQHLCVAVLLTATGCVHDGDASPPPPPGPPPPTAPEPTPEPAVVEPLAPPTAEEQKVQLPRWVDNGQPRTETSDGDGIPFHIVSDNLGVTDYTAVVHHRRGKVKWRNDEPPTPRGYVTLLYEADVLETLRGAEHESIIYSVMSEVHEPHMRSYPLLVSLCRDGPDGNNYYVPDNGFVGAATPAVLKRLRRIAASKNKKKSATAGACNPPDDQ